MIIRIPCHPSPLGTIRSRRFESGCFILEVFKDYGSLFGSPSGNDSSALHFVS